MMKRIFVKLCAMCMLSVMLVGCAHESDKLPYEGDNAQYIYATGHKLLKEGDYSEAITAFKSLNAQYPFEYYSQLGSLELIYAYYLKSDAPMMTATANQFIKLYPQNKNVGYAYYMLGVAHFDNGRGFLQRRLPYNMAQHDPESYKKAFFEFRRAISLDPKAGYVQDARRRMIYLNNIVGQYEYNIAKYNYEHQAYVGAVNRAKIVIEQYPRSEAVQSALVILAKSYMALDLPQMADATVKVLAKNFPENAYLKEIHELTERKTVVVN